MRMSTELKLAKAVIDYDDVVDNLFNDVKADMIRLINEDTEMANLLLT